MKKPFKPMSPGLGVLNWVKRRLAVKRGTLPIGQMAFKSLVLEAPITKLPILGGLYKTALMFTNRRTTQGYSLPLNLDLSGEATPVALPIDLMKKAIRESTYRAAMNSCICRDAYKCTDYPRDLACIFLGKAARICVENGIAHTASVEECLERVDRAASLGLNGQAYWIEVEGFIWGFQNEDMDKFLELCFCCPCCCVASKFMRKADSEASLLFQRSVGPVAVASAACTNCGACIPVCPRHAMKPGTERVAISGDCGGCGMCVPKCPSKALTIQHRTPLKADIKDYFEGLELYL